MLVFAFALVCAFVFVCVFVVDFDFGGSVFVFAFGGTIEDAGREELALDEDFVAELLIVLEKAALLAGELGGAVAIGVEGVDGEGVESTGVDAGELGADGDGHALDLDIEETGFGGGLAAEAPEGDGHFVSQGFFDEIGGLPGAKVGVDELVEIGEFFAGEEEVLGISAMFEGVGGGTAFAFGGLGAGGMERVEPGGSFAFVVGSHSVPSVAGGLAGELVKLFRIIAEWL